jgi:uncharacterized protein (TIGR03437 family)
VQSIPYVVGYREDGSPLSPENPAEAGEDVMVLGTGFGKYQIRPVEGFALPATPVYPLLEALTATLNGAALNGVAGAGHPGQSGVVAVKFTVPANASGPLPLQVRVLDAVSPEVFLPVAAAQASPEAALEVSAPPAP